MDIFEAMKWCYNNSYEELVCEATTILYNNEIGGFVREVKGHGHAKLNEFDICDMAKLNLKFTRPKTQFTKELYQKWLDGEEIYFISSTGCEEMVDNDVLDFSKYILKESRFYTK